ncbi:hypothetical protein Ddye_012818 [Dipteronia dyeriana]|uniref:Cytochrome c assembly protein domain-containing protein n=1 Tax=Dipteronia dyeriana TaxID=168575 RepID=A0AAE0CJ11_9ROSI|nr:hypothetical protein Ddye_012818 [Dipteronia dyeriana]
MLSHPFVLSALEAFLTYALATLNTRLCYFTLASYEKQNRLSSYSYWSGVQKWIHPIQKERFMSLGWEDVGRKVVGVGIVWFEKKEFLIASTEVTGGFRGRPVWGTFWVWDARLTSVFISFLIYLGALRFQKLPVEPASISIRAGPIDIPIIKSSVNWWNTSHQSGSISRSVTKSPTSAKGQSWTHRETNSERKAWTTLLAQCAKKALCASRTDLSVRDPELVTSAQTRLRQGGNRAISKKSSSVGKQLRKVGHLSSI